MAPSGTSSEPPECSKCNVWLRLELGSDRIVDGRRVAGTVPVLVCPECSRETVPEVVRRAARASRGRDAELFPPRRFGLCGEMGFRYSSVDWDVIPLLRQSEHEPDGYCAPVFFDQRALLKYMVRPEYAMDYVRDGGVVRFADGSSLKYGINRSGRMVCWLGELDRIPEQEQHYLLSDNLESDHDVASGLYRDRLGLPKEPSKEQRLAGAFHDATGALQGILLHPLWKLHHKEVQTLHSLARPVVWSEFVSYAVNGLNKIFVESIDLDFLHAELKRLKVRPSNPNNKIDCVEDLVGARFGVCDGLDLSPFDDLRVWRNTMDHVSKDERGAKDDWARIREMPQNPEYEERYDDILDGLVEAYERIARHVTLAP